MVGVIIVWRGLQEEAISWNKKQEKLWGKAFFFFLISSLLQELSEGSVKGRAVTPFHWAPPLKGSTISQHHHIRDQTLNTQTFGGILKPNPDHYHF
jgi:hypothetical protein